MRILFDARFYGLENGGLGRYTINLVGQLAKIDKENDYIILLKKKYFNRLNLPDNWQKVLADFQHYSLTEQIKLPNMISGYKPDIVHFPHFNIPLLYKGKFIATIHDMIMHKSKGKEATTLPAFLYLIKRLGYKYVFASAVKRAVKIIVPSKTVKKELADYYKIEKGKIVVTYEGFDERIKKSSKKKIDVPYFVYAGNTYPHKNIKRAIKAIVHLNATSKQKILFAIASPRVVFIKRLKKTIKNLEAEEYVRLLGLISDEELGALYKNALAFVYPSLLEGFGLQGLESISVGTLVLVSDIPVFKEIYKDSVLYFNPLASSSIAGLMKKVVEMGPRERKERIKRSQEFIKRYSWAKMAKQTLQVYDATFTV